MTLRAAVARSFRAGPAVLRPVKQVWGLEQKRFASNGVTASERLSSFRKLLKENEGKRVVRVMEAHSGLSALIAEKAKGTRADGSEASFDGLWSSSLTSSTVKGKPDIETVDTSERIAIVEDMLDVTTKPVVYDGDTGGLPEIFYFTVRTLERLGVSAVIIEDKAGLKQNSLFGTEREQQLEDVDVFVRKIQAGKKAQVTKDFMVIARLEAMIAGMGVDETIRRAQIYIEQGGCDAVMVHSKEKSPDEVLEFFRKYKALPKRVPVVAVPTTYNMITEDELRDAGASVVIYANMLLRAAYPSMVNAAELILQHGRAKEVDEVIMSVKKILTLIDDGTGN